jgi:hypothetical protein
MRPLSQRKTRLVFETDDFVFERGHQRQVVIEARPRFAMVRLKGRHTGFPICYAAVYHAAAKLAAEDVRRLKERVKPGGKAAKKKAGRT